MKGTCGWICFFLGALFIGTAINQQFDFDFMTDIASAQLINLDSLEIVDGAMEDDYFLYAFTLSPVNLIKVNKSEMAILSKSFDASSRFHISDRDTVSSGLLVNGNIYLLGLSTIYRVPVSLADINSLQFPVPINPVTSFYYQNNEGEQFLNFPSYGGEPLFYQVSLDRFDNASVHSFPLPAGDFQASVFDGNKTAYLGTYTGQFYQLDLDTLDMPFNFRTQDITVHSLHIDAPRNILYFCGDYVDSAGPYFVKIELEKVSTATLTIPRDPTYKNRTIINDATGVSATFVGESPESTCRGFSLDLDRDQAIVYEFHPPSSSGQLYRINTNTMEIIDELSATGAWSIKIVAGLINTAEQLVYYVTESEAISVFYPANNSVVIRPTPPVDPPHVDPFDRLTVIATADIITNEVELLNGLVEDDEYLYVYTLSPIQLARVSKSELARTNNTFDASLADLQYGTSEAAVSGLCVNDYIYLFGQSTIFKVPTNGNLSTPEILKFPFDINARTSFYTKERYNVEHLNFLNADLEHSRLYQVPLDRFNESYDHSFDFVSGEFQATASDGNATTYFATHDGHFYLPTMKYWPVIIPSFDVFAVSDMTVTSLNIDWTRNTMYFCGEYGTVQGTYFVMLRLDSIPNNSALTVPRDPTYTNRTQINVADGIAATFVGTSAESICKGFALDVHRNQAIVYEYNPLSSAGRLYRINTQTMEIIDELAISSQLSRKPVAGLINTKEQLLYLITELQVLSVFYPASTDPIEPTPVSDSSPETEPISDTPSEIPFFSIPIASSGHFIVTNLVVLMTLVFSVL